MIMRNVALIILSFFPFCLLSQTIGQSGAPIHVDSVDSNLRARVKESRVGQDGTKSFDENLKTEESEIRINSDFLRALDAALSFDPIEPLTIKPKRDLTLDQLHEWVGEPTELGVPNLSLKSDSALRLQKLLYARKSFTSGSANQSIQIPNMIEKIRNVPTPHPDLSFDFGMAMGQLFIPKERRLKKLRQQAKSIRREMDGLYPILPDELQVVVRDTTSRDTLVSRIFLEVMSCELPNHLLAKEGNSEQWVLLSASQIRGSSFDRAYDYLLLVRKYVPRHSQDDTTQYTYEVMRVMNMRKQKLEAK